MTDRRSGYMSVTPLLHVGNELPMMHVAVDNAAEAVAAIEARLTVLVPSDEIAIDVLRRLGLSTADVADRMHFARTGRILRR